MEVFDASELCSWILADLRHGGKFKSSIFVAYFVSGCNSKRIVEIKVKKLKTCCLSVLLNSTIEAVQWFLTVCTHSSLEYAGIPYCSMKPQNARNLAAIANAR